MQASLQDYEERRGRRINWKKLIESRDDYPSVSKMEDPKYAGWVIHEWIKDRFSYMNVLFDQFTCWHEDGEIVYGKYDAWDGENIYEFKTKKHYTFSRGMLPFDKDEEQMRDYMRSTRSRNGYIVYIDRKTFRVQTYEINLF